MKLMLTVFIYVVATASGDDDSGWSLVDNPLVTAYPCNGSTDIQVMYEPERSPDEENQYNLWIQKKFPKNTIIKLKFDKGATVTLTNQSVARIDLDKSDEHAFRIRFFKPHESICLNVQGCALGVVSYIIGVNINTKEYCREPVTGFLDSHIEGYKTHAQSSCIKLNEQDNRKCGRAQILVKPLSVNGEARRGDWPWHVALLKNGTESYKERYLCGGTLISNYHVLTAAHCVFRRAILFLPEQLSLALGKYNLNEPFELGAEERDIEKINDHEHFNDKNLYNDIALLKMKTEITFNNYIQPACLWHENAPEKLESDAIIGTFVGWGVDDSEKLSSRLNQAQISMISTITCLRSFPSYYSLYLNAKNFCAGNLKEAVACSGDSGGGFYVFIPDKESNNSTTGAWHIRGLVSNGVADENRSCSGDHYTLFTDISKYRKWITSHM